MRPHDRGMLAAEPLERQPGGINRRQALAERVRGGAMLVSNATAAASALVVAPVVCRVISTGAVWLTSAAAPGQGPGMISSCGPIGEMGG